MLTKSLILLSDLGHGPLYFTLTLALIIMGWRRSSFAKGQVSEWLWLGGRLALFWVGGVLLSACLKYHFCAPRPWWIDPQVLPLHPHPAKGFGMPSGHTQSAVGLLLFALCLPRAIAERAGVVHPPPSWGRINTYKFTYVYNGFGTGLSPPPDLAHTVQL